MLGNAIKETNARNNTTSYTYDTAGRLAGAAYPDGSTNSIAYDEWNIDGDDT